MATAACRDEGNQTMTLFKQIAILVSLVLLLLSGIFILNDFSRSARFMQGQMQTTAQDMATTLGIAIGNLPDSDEATLEVLFNSVFDSGYYSKIELISTDGLILHEKSQAIVIHNVPAWFIDRIGLNPAHGSTQVMRGWSQLGELGLTLHPGYVYSGLYATFKTTLSWLALIIIGTMVLLWVFLHYLLRPLKQVKEQADFIQNNQFVQQQNLPATVELKRVVEAMNAMVSRVQRIYTEQEEALSRSRHLLYHDNLSGLGNRRYLMDHLQQSLAEGSSFHGCLVIIKMVHFEQLRERQDYATCDELVRSMASLISAEFNGLKAEKIARLSDDEYAFLLAVDAENTVAFIHALNAKYKQLSLLEKLSDEVYLVAGVSALEAGQEISSILSRADYHLTQALAEGPYTVKLEAPENLSLPQGKMQWRQWFDQVFQKNWLFLVGQLVLDQERKPVQKELFIRVRGDAGQVIPASSFMPMASSLGMSIDIDRTVFRLISSTKDLASDIPLALNLSAAFFELADARNDFEQMLQKCSQRGIQLCIEASHHALMQHKEMCRQVAEKVRQQGHQFGIDNLDLGLSLQLLQSTRFDYVKINASSLVDFSSEETSTGFQALKTITHALGIEIIVVGVDSAQTFEQLAAAGIDVMQGNLLGKPEPL